MNNFMHKWRLWSAGLQGIKLFFHAQLSWERNLFCLWKIKYQQFKLIYCKAELSMEFFLLINFIMPTFVGILIFISTKKFHAQLSWAWKKVLYRWAQSLSKVMYGNLLGQHTYEYNASFHGIRNVIFQLIICDIFHVIIPNIDCGGLLELPWRGSSNEYPQSIFFNRNKKNTVKFHY